MTLDVHRLVQLGRVTAIAAHPSEPWLAVAVQRLDRERSKYVCDLWRVFVDGERAPERLTSGESNDHSPCFDRHGDLGFLSNRALLGRAGEDGDSDRAQVWLLPSGGGEPFELTDEPLGVSAFRFASRGDRLVVVANVLPGVAHDDQRKRAHELDKHGPSALHYTRMPVRFWDHWLEIAAPHLVVYGERGSARRDLTPSADRELREGAFEVSPDGAMLAATWAVRAGDAIDDGFVRLFPADGSAPKDVGIAPRTVQTFPVFSSDGRSIATVAQTRFDDRAPTARLHVIDTGTGRTTDIAPGWDSVPEHVWFGENDKALYVIAPDRGASPVFRVAMDGSVTRVTSAESGGTHHDLVPLADGRIAGLRSRLTHPPEPFVVDPRGAPAEPRLLANLSGFSDEEGRAIASIETRSARSDDGSEVAYSVVSPNVSSGPKPLLFWVHGGPIGSWGDGWHWRWNPLVFAGAGFSVALPNPRGSTGYGQKFIDGIWGNRWGEECYVDLMRVVDALETRDDVDRDRIGVMGGSFGGYMANWIGGKTDRFRCIVTHASLFDMSAFYGVTDEPGWFGLELGGAPWLEGFDRNSPHVVAKGWKSPTLVIHGERDYRVPVSEGLALFQWLQAAGVPSELLIFPNENHWILKPRNVVSWYETVLGFVRRHLDG
jgi:dipeptidyl aminopeptidase/acylaminoacyl peptidase